MNLFYRESTTFINIQKPITQAIKKCQMSTSLGKVWGTNLSKTCYSAVFIKKVNVLWIFIKKAFLKTIKLLAPIFSCEFSKYFQLPVVKKTEETIASHCMKSVQLQSFPWSVFSRI